MPGVQVITVHAAQMVEKELTLPLGINPMIPFHARNFYSFLFFSI